jgi:uncharacterized protein
MAPTLLTVGFLAALLTSMISAVIGMGGGITLLAVMVCFLDYPAVIALHGCIQLVSNLSRTTLFLRSIRWKVFLQFLTGALPLSFLGITVVQDCNPEMLKISIGVFILFSLYFPIRKLPEFKRLKGSFLMAGMLAGSVSLVVGATGPLIAPFFLVSNLKKEEIIATKAICQSVIHILKILLFGLVLNFKFQDYSSLILWMSMAVIIGTYLGKTILSRYVSERAFRLLYQGILTLIGLKLLLFR